MDWDEYSRGVGAEISVPRGKNGSWENKKKKCTVFMHKAQISVYLRH